ncbi:hypothetical protein GHT06_007076 [Daphnia sinensis]|uniref:Uncharacterized protein n=2 Tax=Daphnia TaxID=6668 RepID=E9HZH0_DAPPU|nr:hypothetical protein DAPPUDRAFT_126039 [Daphnia pulex]EFX60779.1 hypothetical protein DAPPUDRAFT_122996 [Daphnia pulex]EFX60798.1 hypothetical protein DAPPUDRAFT_122906 [Daphnia pulex]EFX62861.1 hypothetical protein DAPPUDRAFT_119797 [Daphnia pulex]KAI9549883.1 hypothetical protein GHT06_007076 [Daphnia sinensis]|eukprot:EFX59970.1 hypothetical protein DAPPUDRAFT_126039 [Daphnia pulex]
MGIIAVPNPNHEGGSAVTRSFRTGRVKHADSFSVARVRPRTSKGITDLLLLTVTRLDAACPSKKTALESRSLSELTRQIAPPTKNGHAPPPTESRKSSQSVNPSSVRAW